MKKAICIFLAALITMTSQKVTSQTDNSHKPEPWAGVSIGSTKDGVSPELLKEYSQIVSKYGSEGDKWWIKFKEDISIEDQNRLEQIYKQMSLEQQGKQKVKFIKSSEPPKEKIPTEKEFTAWKNKNVYGVWIDGKKIDNAVLNNYSNTDFMHAGVSRLYGAAKRNKIYAYQVNLTTKEYYRKHNEQSKAKSGNRMVFVY